jgi:crotonobetainyl-CoA:carnitine CoA-transferase CaiB-like acyl-CoA transferase
MAGRGKGPLAGVRVLDLTSVLMGPYATQIFADLGADVIKVEDPRGDTTRFLPPGPSSDRGAMFVNLNRGKRSLALDLKKPKAREALLELARDADVFIHSMRAGAIKRLGLDYEAVRAANPAIIYANLYGFGRAGRYRDFPAYDDIVQAASGLADLQARLNGGEPAYLATVVADKVAGLSAAYAVCGALFAREKGAGGQEIEVPMFETLASFALAEHLCGSLYDPPLGPPEYPRVVSPQRRPYRTRDGYLAVMIYTDQHWRAFFDAIGHPDWSTDPMFADIPSRTRNIGTVLGRLVDVLAERSNDEWMAVLTEAQIPAMPILSLTDLLDDPHLAEAGFWVERDTADGRVRFPAIPTYFSGTPGEIGDPGPAHGADGEAILADAGFSHERIVALRESGALRGC